MLAELRIRDLAIIDALDLAFGPGLSVLTGETGAGKSIIIDAVNLLLGDRGSQEVVRNGADRTQVEGEFTLSPAVADRLAPLLEQGELDGDQPGVVTLAREIRSSGRSVARVNGRPVTTALLAEIGALLVDVHGQGEHLSLLRQREHAGLLDRYAGLAAEAGQMAGLVRAVRGVRRDLEGLRLDARERARRIDLLTYQVGEIGAAGLRPGEEHELEAERKRLANAEQLAGLAAEAAALLAGEEDERSGALDALSTAGHALDRLGRIDPAAAPLAEQLAEAAATLDDLARELARYRDAVEFNPRRLEQVEDRLHLIRELQRKYGDTTAEVLAYAARAGAEVEEISNAGERIGALEAEEARLLDEIGTQGARLSALRRAAGERMAQTIERELADLQMPRARFAVRVTWQPDVAGAPVDPGGAAAAGERPGRYAFDLRGLDDVAFLVSANPGEPLKPLVKVASGGETSRLMLALKTVLGRADETPTLIFDEIDQGIGGRVGATVGRKLWGLTAPEPGSAGAPHQVLCITHLPQLAAYGDAHYRVAKRLTAGRTVTEVLALANEARLDELAQMLGAASQAGRASAAEMLAEVERIKEQP